MAILTPLTLQEAQELGLAYGLHITSIAALKAGSVNSNFEITTATGRFFLRIYEEQGPDTAAREAALLTHLSRASVPTPEPIERCDASGFITLVSNKPAAIFPFCAGHMVCQKGVSIEKAGAVGRALRQIHDAGQSIDAGVSSFAGDERFGRDALRGRLARLSTIEASAEIRATCEDLETFLRRPVPPARARGLIHGDVFRDNVLWQGDTISAVLDFESASFGSLAFDLMVTVLAWCFGDDLEPSLASALVSGYRELGGLDPDLVGDLYEAGLFACARFTTTRLTDFELRPRETTVYKDFRRWKQRMARLEALGPEGLVRELGIDPVSP